MTQAASFTETTPRHALPLLFAGQVQKEFFVNESLARLDLLLHPAIIEERADPPANPAAGACYLVAAQATGAWQGMDSCLAAWDGDGWTIAAPQPGMTVRDLTSGTVLLFDQQWQRFAAPPPPAGGTVVDLEARSAIGQITAALKEFGIFS